MKMHLVFIPSSVASPSIIVVFFKVGKGALPMTADFAVGFVEGMGPWWHGSAFGFTTKDSIFDTSCAQSLA
jgi:hypothetical protein